MTDELDTVAVVTDAERIVVLQRIDTAIKRLSALAITPTIAQSITNLEMKRGWVESGNYVLRQINEEGCAVIGREIATMTKAYAGCKNLLKAG